MHRSRAALGVAMVCGLLVASAAPAADAPRWRVERAEVRVTVPLKPGGAFEARSAAVTGTVAPSGARPVRLEGELALDLATLDTGITLRNQHLREKYLEVAKGPGYDRALLTDVAVADAGGVEFAGRSAFSGTLLLHGTKRAVTGTADIRREGGGVRVDASFPLTLTDFAIQPPEYLGVGVANRIIVRVLLTAAPGTGAR